MPNVLTFELAAATAVVVLGVIGESAKIEERKKGEKTTSMGYISTETEDIFWVVAQCLGNRYKIGYQGNWSTPPLTCFGRHHQGCQSTGDFIAQ